VEQKAILPAVLLCAACQGLLKINNSNPKQHGEASGLDVPWRKRFLSFAGLKNPLLLSCPLSSAIIYTSELSKIPQYNV
jgi:hypothetical protein